MDLTDPRNWKHATEYTPDEFIAHYENVYDYVGKPMQFKKELDELTCKARTKEFLAAFELMKTYLGPFDLTEYCKAQGVKRMKFLTMLKYRAKKNGKYITVVNNILTIRSDDFSKKV